MYYNCMSDCSCPTGIHCLVPLPGQSGKTGPYSQYRVEEEIIFQCMRSSGAIKRSAECHGAFHQSVVSDHHAYQPVFVLVFDPDTVSRRFKVCQPYKLPFESCLVLSPVSS